jgi:hypothetical protein
MSVGERNIGLNTPPAMTTIPADAFEAAQANPLAAHQQVTSNATRRIRFGFMVGYS